MTNSGVNGNDNKSNGNKIVMGIPSLGLYHKEFITSLMTVSLGQVLENYCIMEGALLPQSRNMILRLIYQHDPDFTHVLFCDDDMCNFNAKTILDLIEADKDVISAVKELRNTTKELFDKMFESGLFEKSLGKLKLEHELSDEDREIVQTALENAFGNRTTK